MTKEFLPGKKIELILPFINQCDNDDIIRRTTQEIGQLAVKYGMYSEAESLFQICLSKIPKENTEVYLAASFSKSQSIYENPNHVYSETELPELEGLTQLCGKENRMLNQKKSICIHYKQRHQLSWIFLAKALINLSKWNDLRGVIERAPSMEMLFLVFESSVNVLPDIYIMCLRKLLDLLTDTDIDRFSILFRNTAEVALLADTASAMPYFHHVYPIMKHTNYPKEEAIWLHTACINAADRMRTLKDHSKSRAWSTLAVAFTQ